MMRGKCIVVYFIYLIKSKFIWASFKFRSLRVPEVHLIKNDLVTGDPDIGLADKLAGISSSQIRCISSYRYFYYSTEMPKT